MTEAQIKDTILRFFLDRKGNTIQSNIAAEKLALTEDELIKYCGFINLDLDKAIEMLSGGMIYKHLMSIRQKEIPKVTRHLERGGFEKMVDTENESLRKQEEMYKLSIENLTLSNDAAHQARLNADKAESRAKASIRAAWVASISAAVVILWEVYKTIVLGK